MNDHQHELAILAAMQGATCIYKEKSLIRLVNVTKAKIDEWGATFGLEVVPAPGFIDDERKQFFLSCCWEYLSVSDGSVSASGYIGWQMVFGVELVERIKHFAATNTDLYQLMRFINRVECTEPELSIEEVLKELDQNT